MKAIAAKFGLIVVYLLAPSQIMEKETSLFPWHGAIWRHIMNFHAVIWPHGFKELKKIYHAI